MSSPVHLRTSSVTTPHVALGFALVFTLVVGCGGESGAVPSGGPPAAEKPAEPISIGVGRVTRDTMVSLYSTSATLRAEFRATITSRTRGVIEELAVEEGDRVTVGQTLAKLEDDEQVLALDRAKTLYEIKQREYERSKTLHEQNVISDNEYEVVRTSAEESKHDVEIAQLEYDRTTIAAPFAGVIVRRHLDVGAAVNDGTAMYDIADIDPLYADVNVPERHVVQLAPGQSVRLATDGADTVQARIERIAPIVDAATGTVKVTIAIARDVALRPGTFVQVNIVTDTHENALVVPRTALVAEGRRWNVFRVTDSDTAQAIEVRLGFEEGDRVEIAELVDEDDRLEVGDRIVIAGAAALNDGAPVKILRDDASDGAESAESDPANEGGVREEVAASRN